MTDPPRRRLPTAGERLKTVLPRFSPGSAQGLTRNTGPVTPRSNSARVLRLFSIFAIVFHGGDGTVARPDVLLTFWVGAATPANGLDYDLWYTATI